MSKDLTARTRIIEFLRSHGSVHDSRGGATAVLREAVGYQGSPLGFVQLISSMEKSGQLIREVRGKRTYRISLPNALAGAAQDVRSDASTEGVPSTQTASVMPVSDSHDAASVGQLDYDRLAGALLTRITKALTTPAEPSRPAPSVRRRLDQLAVRTSELEREVARSRAERDAVAAERDELREQLEAASHNLSLLTERLGGQRRPPSPAAERLGSEDRALLYKLVGRPGEGEQEQVG